MPLAVFRVFLKFLGRVQGPVRSLSGCSGAPLPLTLILHPIYVTSVAAFFYGKEVGANERVWIPLNSRVAWMRESKSKYQNLDFRNQVGGGKPQLCHFNKSREETKSYKLIKNIIPGTVVD